MTIIKNIVKLLKYYGVIICLILIPVFAFKNNTWLWGVTEYPMVIPAPQYIREKAISHDEIAIFAGGCFWGVQGVFQHVKGVKNAVSGYAGGYAETANYEQVSDSDTGHAESVQVTFDPTQVTYGELLHIFFSVGHNPTELNRQGPDTGSQYRSAIFPMNEVQAEVAKRYIVQLETSEIYNKPLATKIERGTFFYPAEAYHQNFINNNPNHPYVVVNDLPKIKNLYSYFPENYSQIPVLVSIRQEELLKTKM